MCCWALLRGLQRMTLAFMRMRAGLVANLKNNSVQYSIRLHYRWFLGLLNRYLDIAIPYSLAQQEACLWLEHCSKLTMPDKQ